MANMTRNACQLGKNFLGITRPLLQRSQNTQLINKRSLNIGMPSLMRLKNLSTPVKIGLVGGVTYIFFSDIIINLFSEKEEYSTKVTFKGNEVQQLQNNYALTYFPPEPKKIAEEIVSPVDNTKLDLTLYQFKTCPFCCKVRAFLDYYGFSYKVVEVNSVSREETKWSKYRKVPFITFHEEGSPEVYQLKDSSMIISFLKSYVVNPTASVTELLRSFPIMDSIAEDGLRGTTLGNQYNVIWGREQNDKHIKHEMEWRKWVDEVFVHYLSVNIYRTFSESRQAFKWFSKAGNWEELFPWHKTALVQCVGPPVMYFIGKRLQKKHNIGEDVRGSFYEGTNKWLKEIENRGSKFMGGDRPDLSDLAAYGILTAIEGCDTFKDLVTHTKIGPWYEAMTTEVKEHHGSDLLQNFSR